jgi:hypothetical protein
MEDISILVLLRSEAEQLLVGQELIKVLSDFNQLIVTPLSPHTQQFTSSMKNQLWSVWWTLKISIIIRGSKLNLCN